MSLPSPVAPAASLQQREWPGSLRLAMAGGTPGPSPRSNNEGQAATEEATPQGDARRDSDPKAAAAAENQSRGSRTSGRKVMEQSPEVSSRGSRKAVAATTATAGSKQMKAVSSDPALDELVPRERSMEDIRRDVHYSLKELEAHHTVLRDYLCTWVNKLETIVLDVVGNASPPCGPVSTSEGSAVCKEVNDDGGEPSEVLPHQPSPASAQSSWVASFLEDEPTADPMRGDSFNPRMVFAATVTAPQSEDQNLLSSYNWISTTWAKWVATVAGYRINLPKAGKRDFLARFVSTFTFEMGCMFLIVLNSALTWWNTDAIMEDVGQWSDDLSDAVEWTFCALYTIELLLRIHTYRVNFILGPDWKWNLFDAFIVFTSIQDRVLEVNSQAGMSFSVLRAMRLLRMLRLLRIIHFLVMFRELRIILQSLMGSMKLILWCTLLTIFILFQMASIFMQAVAENTAAGTTWTPQTQDGIDKYWHSVGRAMLSLYMSSTGGVDWEEIAAPLFELGFIYYSIFVLYTGIFSFVFMNIFTSMIVDAVMQISKDDQERVMHLELQRKDKHISLLQEWFNEIDADKSGEVSFQEFCQHIQDREVVAFAAGIGLDVLDAKRFFNILSEYGRRKLDLETFVVGCIRCQGQAQRVDVMDVLFSLHRVSLHIQSLTRYVEKEIKTARKTNAGRLQFHRA